LFFSNYNEIIYPFFFSGRKNKMLNLFEILQSEIERLFNLAELKILGEEYLNLGQEIFGSEDIAKIPLIKKLIQYCISSGKIDALVDSIFLMKGESVDPRISQIPLNYIPFGVPQKSIANQYEAQLIIGEGGTGIVVSAISTKSNSEYAIKFIRPEIAQYKRGTHRYISYIQSLMKNKVSGITEIFDCGFIGETPFIVMKKMDSQNLATSMEKRQFDLKTILKILISICGIIIDLHSSGRTYGCLKPSKIFLKIENNEPVVTLLPGGHHLLLFRINPGIDRSGTGVGAGTAKYLTPEQLRGEIAQQSSDIYNFGLLSYELLTGTYPFNVKNYAEVIFSHLRKEPGPPSKRAPRASIPPRFDDLIMRCLEKDITRRPSSMGAIRKELESILEEEIKAIEISEGIRKATIEELNAMGEEFLENPEVPELAEEVILLTKGANAWERGIEILKSGIEKTSDKEAKRDLLFRLARFFEKDIRDFEEAANCYRRILEIYPDDDVAEAGVMDCLRNLHRYEDLVSMILDKIEKTEDEKTRNALLKEVATIYEKENEEPQKALIVYLQIFQSDPQDKDVIENVGRLAEKTGNWNDVMSVINSILNQPGTSSEKAILALQCAAKWYMEKLGRTDFALNFYEKILALSPFNEVALDGMAKIYRAKGEYKELVNVLQRIADMKPAGIEKREIMTQIASIYQHNLSDIKQAESIYMAIFEEDPLYDETFNALEKMLTDQARWKDLAKILKRRADLIEDPDKKVQTLFPLAEIMETRLSDIPQAIEIHNKIIEIKPDHILSIKALELIYSNLQDAKNLIRILEKEFAITTTPRQKFENALRQASIYEEEFMDNEKALELINTALEINPNNLTALASKARLLRKLEKFEELLKVIDEEFTYESDNEVKVNLLFEKAKILSENFHRYEEAITCMENALSIPGGEKQKIVSELVKLCEISGDFKSCVKWLMKLVEITESRSEKSKILVRIGDIQREKLREEKEALNSYQKAVDLDPGNVQAADSLKAVFAGIGDHGAALQMLKKELDVTEGEIAKAKIYVEMGKIYRYELKDIPKAIEHFEMAFKLDPTSVEAGEPLAELYRETNRWDDTLKIFEHFSASVKAMKKEKGMEFFLRFGEVCLKKEDYAKAKIAFSNAREMDPRDGYAMERLAFTLYQMKDYKEAASIYNEYLLRFEDSLKDKDNFDIHLKLSVCYKETDELVRATETLTKAINLNPNSVEPYKLRAEIFERREKWEEAIQDLKKVTEFVSDEEKFDILIKIAQITQEKIKDNEKASRTYQMALEIKPDHRATLLKLVELYMAMEKWQKVVEVVLKLADLVEDKKELATYYKTAAQICDKYLGRKEDALSYYELAVENDPTQLDVLEAIANIMTDKNDWLGLERTYKKMLDRLPEDVKKEVKANLWHKLAELYLHRLERIPEAVNAYETALKLDPTQRRWMEALADLYGDDMRYSDKAISLNREILQLTPFRIESYKTLCRVYRKKGKFDQAWCVSSVLRSLNVEDEDVVELYNAYKSDEPSEVTERLNEDLWSRYLIHPNVDEKITGIFKIIEEAILKSKGQTHLAANLKPEYKLDPASSDQLLPKYFHYAAESMGIRLPDFYLRREEGSTGIVFTPTYPPAILIGEEALKAENTQTLAFVTARHLTYYLPGFYLRIFLQTGTSLSTWILSAIKFIIPQFPVPGDFKNKVPDALGILKKNLDQYQKDMLAVKIQAFIESTTEDIDLKKWAAGIDFTADRAGLLLCGDVNIALSIIRKMQVDSWFASVKDRVAEISLFAVSDEFFILRQKMGIAIQTE